MKCTGIVVEYNPFHNGHLHHLRQSKTVTGSDIVAAVMSGNFLQRGEPAMIDKWTRANMALAGGADIVIELPYDFAVQKADRFAFGAISLLEALRCDSFCFGSESGNVEAFGESAELLQANEAEYNRNVRKLMKEGLSYPEAVSKAFSSIQSGAPSFDITQPNNILGFQYILAARAIGSRMMPFTIPRKSAGYHDEHFADDSIASATSIRKSIRENGSASIQNFVPESTYKSLCLYEEENGLLHSWELYWPYLQYRLLTTSLPELNGICEITEGIEYRLKEAAKKASSFREFMTIVKTKRYTWTRIQRMCVHILTNAAKSDVGKHIRPQYIRLLGMSDAGRAYLNSIKKDLELPLISRAAAGAEQAELDIRSSQVYALPLAAGLKKEFSQAPILYSNRLH